jgi:type III restriction enzyme
LYHSPLGVTLTNTVTKENSDLHLYFNELKNFAENNFDQQLFNDAKKELVNEIKKKKRFMYDVKIENFDYDLIESISPQNVLYEVFNSEEFSGIEYLDSKDQKEIGLRLKSSIVSSPFALIKIGDIGEWKNSILSGYSYTGSFEVKNYFDNLNQNENINILMGSRAFYEGWDSPRPNVLNCINIGKTDAKKFILQAIGRGIRLEPVENYRKRLKYLYLDNKLKDETYSAIVKYNTLIESLFIFATDEEMIEDILTSLEEQKSPDKVYKINLRENENKPELFVPIFKEVKKDYSKIPRFSISHNALERLKNYISSTPDNVLIMQYFLLPEEIDFLREYLTQDKNIKIDNESNFSDLTIAINKLISYMRSSDREHDGFKQMDEEIIHFLNVNAVESDYQHIQREVSKVINFVEISTKNPNTEKLMKELFAGRIAAKANYRDLDIKFLAQHYYYPVIYSNDEKIDYINHIIKVEGEVQFIKKLEKFLENEEDYINERYDWWMFSKVDESLDRIYIPYYDNGKIRKYNPDFIFWMKKGTDYRILFVDPKGTAQSSFINKVGGYERFFKGKTFKHNGYTIKVDLILFNEVNPFTDNYYSGYWKSEIRDIFI